MKNKKLSYKYFVIMHLTSGDHVYFFKSEKEAQELINTLDYLEVSWSLCDIANKDAINERAEGLN